MSVGLEGRVGEIPGVFPACVLSKAKGQLMSTRVR